MSPRLVLVHSPLVGPQTWDELTGILAPRGVETVVGDLTPTVRDGPPYAERQVATVAAAVGQRRAILVGHSRAGALLGAVAAAAPGVEAYVFVDAGLPAPGESWFQSAPVGATRQLSELVHEGWLPPWPGWWPPEALEQRVPDPEVRAGFVAGCPPLPWGMFEEALPLAPGWQQLPGAYLRLSEGYQQQADRARELG